MSKFWILFYLYMLGAVGLFLGLLLPSFVSRACKAILAIYLAHSQAFHKRSVFLSTSVDIRA